MTDFVSLVVTVKNERASINGFVDSLLAQTRRPDEVVIVDGGSTDGTLDSLEQAARRDPAVRVLSAPGSRIAGGRNAGIRAAKGPIVAVTDAGTALAPDWLQLLVRPLEDDPYLALSSGFYRAGGRTWFERCLGTIITPQIEEIDPERFLPSSRSVAFRKDWWVRVGGYPEWLRHCEDLVFDLELRRAGARFAFTPEAVVAWNSRPNLAAFFRQYFDYARGDGHARLWLRRHAVRYGAYGAGSALLLASRRHRPALVLLAAGCATHFGKFYRRLARRPPFSGRSQLAAALATLPAIVVTGDIAKMCGFPVGLLERAAGRVGPPETDKSDGSR